MNTPHLVLVPALVGLDAADAHDLATSAGVVAVDPTSDGTPTLTGTVTAQDPQAGTRVEPGSPVTVWIEKPGGGGGGGGGGSAPVTPGPLPQKPAGVK